MNLRFTFSVIFLLVFSQLIAQNFTHSEKQLLLSGDTTIMMRILIYTNPMDMDVLGADSKDIDPADSLLGLLSRRMFLSMRDTANPGVGIAAPQVGINRNAFWVQRFDKSGSPFEFFINPKIIKQSILTRKGGEGCLSMPGERGMVMRSYAIHVEYQSFDGGWHSEMLEDFTAVIFQHEYDHLRGMLFSDRIREQQNALALPLPQGMELLIRPYIAP
jgi:peptide deformylase